MTDQEKLLWYFQEMNKEGKALFLKLAFSLVASGTFSKNSDMSEYLKQHLEQMERDVKLRMTEEF